VLVTKRERKLKDLDAISELRYWKKLRFEKLKRREKKETYLEKRREEKKDRE